MAISSSEYLLWELRRHRERLGLTQEAWGERVYFSHQHVSGVERGTRPVKLEYLAVVDRTFGTSFVMFYENFVRNELAPVWLRPWLEYERRATSIRVYQPSVIPGLFQTEEYARMVLSSGSLQPAEVERQVQVRIGRQSILDRDAPTRVAAIMDEIVLHRGDPAVMPEQLRHLAELARRPNVTIRIVPADAPPHLGWGGPLSIASFDDEEDAAYLDDHLEGKVIASAAQVAALGGVWDNVCSVALTAQQSLALIEKAGKEWT